MRSCQHNMAYSQVADRGDALQNMQEIWEYVEYAVADSGLRGGPQAWTFAEGLTTLHRKKSYEINKLASELNEFLVRSHPRNEDRRLEYEILEVYISASD